MQKITCAHCLRERSPNLMHSCRLCGDLYCIGHRMPERHDCTVNMQRKYLTMVIYDHLHVQTGAKYNNDLLLSYCLQPSKWGMATGMFSSVLDKRYFVHLGNDRCLLNFWALFILIAVSH